MLCLYLGTKEYINVIIGHFWSVMHKKAPIIITIGPIIINSVTLFSRPINVAVCIHSLSGQMFYGHVIG